MYFNYMQNSFEPAPEKRTREEQVTTTEKVLVTQMKMDEDGNEHEVEREVEQEVTKTIEVEIQIPENCIEVDDDVCEAMFNEVNTSATPKAIFANEETHYPEVRELEIVVDLIAEKQSRIAELKANLADTDYQAIKYAEGFITETDYAPIKAQRQAWRDEINALEAAIESQKAELSLI